MDFSIDALLSTLSKNARENLRRAKISHIKTVLPNWFTAADGRTAKLTTSQISQQRRRKTTGQGRKLIVNESTRYEVGR